MTPCPKPPKPVRGTASCRRWMAAVAELGCVICGARPVIVHHTIHDRRSQRRAGDMDTLPLCPRHHDATSPDGLHHAPAAWRRRHGPDHSYLPRVRELVEAVLAVKGAA